MVQLNAELLRILQKPVLRSNVSNYAGATSTGIYGGLNGQLIHRMGAVPLLPFLLNTIHVTAQLRVKRGSYDLIYIHNIYTYQ